MAADDTKGKKRKSAPETAPKAKKARKADDVAASEPKPTRKSARKQAADFMDLDEEKEAAPVVAADPVKPKKGKQTKAAPAAKAAEPVTQVAQTAEVQEKPKKQAKKAKAAVVEETTVTETPKETTKKTKKTKVAVDAPAVVEETTVVTKPKKTNGGKKQEAPEPEVDTTEAVAASDDDDAAEDDQTAALLAGFSDDDDSDDADEDVNFNEDEKIPKLSAKQRKAIKQAEDAPKSNQPGVIYVGRVPRGFFEPQMKKYFSQFGKITQLRLSRNKKTGASKHYAFVEFQSQEVADIVARTMNNYLLFGHILKVHLIPNDQVHRDLFKGANQRFKVDPRNKKAGLEMERGAERSQWEKRVENENKRRGTKAKQLKEHFDYEFEAPALKTVDSIPTHTTITKLKPAESKKLLTDTSAEDVAEVSKGKKGKKGAKAQAEIQPTEVAEAAKVASPAQAKKGKKAAKATAPAESNGVAEEPSTVAEPAADKQNKKDKKRKSDVALETSAVTEETVPEVPAKNKRAKKEKESKPETIVEEVEEKKAAKPKKATKKAKA